MTKTDYLENKVLDHITGKAAYSQPVVYVALFTAAPTDAGGGTEVSGGAYARKQTAGSDWAAASGGSTSNATTLSLPSPTGSWGTVTHWGLFDAVTGGNLLRWATLTTPRSIGSGDAASFPPGALVLTED